jgi:HAE1 family hydrophobic/amphiphilic exporter-1
MFVDFFIRRPVFATVCALLIILAGAVVIPTLPVAQFPNLAPPQVSVSTGYVGASAQTVESAVTIPLEQQINGAQGMKYLTSTSGNDGSSSIVFPPPSKPLELPSPSRRRILSSARPYIRRTSGTPRCS